MSVRGKLMIAVLAIAGAAYLAHQSDSRGKIYQQESVSANGTSMFDGYYCTVDCSGHEAGYYWAEAKGIDDEDICDDLSTNSESFKEGCKAYVNGGDRDDDSARDIQDPSDVASKPQTSTPSADQDNDDDDENPN